MNSGRYLDSLAQGFDPPGSQQQQQRNPYDYFQQPQQHQHSGYNSVNEPAAASNITYDPTASRTQASDVQQQHHGLFMPGGGLNHTVMAAYLDAQQQQQQQQQALEVPFPFSPGPAPQQAPPPPNDHLHVSQLVNQLTNNHNSMSMNNNVNLNVNMNSNVNINSGNHSRHHSHTNGFEYDPLPLQNGPGGGHNHLHERQYSFDDILALNPGILSGVDLDLDPPIPPVSINSSSTNNSHTTPAELYSLPDPYASILNTNNNPHHNIHNHQNINNTHHTHSINSEAWLDELQMGVPGLSLEEMAGTEILNRLRGKMDHVVTRYLPCVDFLVQCQQELRKGLTLATHKRVSYGQRPGRDNMTPRQFYNAYIDLLPQKFYLKNQAIMEHGALTESIHGLNKLIGDAKHMERHGCEQIKNTFLGGMKDGESWGLRKWLSKHGNALHVCTDVECVHQAVQKLDRSLDSTRKLAAILRPMAQQALDRLKNDVPSSYQERSTAHPYLPFFHRLESALRSMATFDPDDDDVICIDDSDDDEVEEVKPQPVKKRKASSSGRSTNGTVAGRFAEACNVTELENEQVQQQQQYELLQQQETRLANVLEKDEESSSGESDNESVVEVVEIKTSDSNKTCKQKVDEDWKCFGCSILNEPNNSFCIACGEEKDLLRDLLRDEFINVKTGRAAAFESDFSNHSSESRSQKRYEAQAPNEEQQSLASTHVSTSTPSSSPPPLAISLTDQQAAATSAFAMAENLDNLADLFDQDPNPMMRPAGIPQASFWDGEQFASALRIFSSMLRSPDSSHFVDRVDEERLFQAGHLPFSHIIKHPLCFRDIVSALLQDPEELGGDLSLGENGDLPVRGLSSWNMWKGTDLLQAIDLVFLNILAYGKAVDEGRSQHRSRTNNLRKSLWNSINDVVVQHVGMDVERRKQYTPTRRSETSGFVVYKIRER
jgi:hypothetical protein